MAEVTQAQVEAFLSARRIAVIGVSRGEQSYSRLLFRELLKQGWDAIPVNPAAGELDARTCHARVGDIVPAPERAVIVLPDAQVEQAVMECVGAGVRDVWLHRSVSRAVAHSAAIRQAEREGLNVIRGLCLFMFLPNASWIHRVHGGVMKLVGAYPK